MVTISNSGYRFPPEIIQHAIWLYRRFTLSFRGVEDLLAERGIMVSYETVRRWVTWTAVSGPSAAMARSSRCLATQHQGQMASEMTSNERVCLAVRSAPADDGMSCVEQPSTPQTAPSRTSFMGSPFLPVPPHLTMKVM